MGRTSSVKDVMIFISKFAKSVPLPPPSLATLLQPSPCAQPNLRINKFSKRKRTDLKVSLIVVVALSMYLFSNPPPPKNVHDIVLRDKETLLASWSGQVICDLTNLVLIARRLYLPLSLFRSACGL